MIMRPVVTGAPGPGFTTTIYGTTAASGWWQLGRLFGSVG